MCVRVRLLLNPFLWLLKAGKHDTINFAIAFTWMQQIRFNEPLTDVFRVQHIFTYYRFDAPMLRLLDLFAR